MRNWIRLATGGLAAVLTVGACGGSDSGKASEAAAETATSSTSTGATAASTTSTTAAASAPSTTTTVAAAPTTVTTAKATTTTASPTTTAPASNPPGPSAVTVRQFQFMPNELVVKAGTKVTWTNQDQILHTATSGATPGTPDGKFDGPMDGVGQSFGFTFAEPGTYPYYCSRHTSMTGKVIVQ